MADPSLLAVMVSTRTLYPSRRLARASLTLRSVPHPLRRITAVWSILRAFSHLDVCPRIPTASRWALVG